MPQKPRALKRGDRIGIVAPASAPFDPTRYESGFEGIRKLGFEPVFAPNARKSLGFLAGTDQERADDLHTMFADPSIAGMICLRGGYGVTRILDLLDADLIRRNPKIFVGYSDITALNSFLLTECDMVSFYGPMIAVEFSKGPTPFTEASFLRMLTCAEPYGPIGQPEGWTLRETLQGGQAEGTLIGGCLTLLQSLIGTKYQVPLRDAILYFEDIDSEPYQSDRVLTHLLASGMMDSVRGVVVGECLDCEHIEGRSHYDNCQSFREVILERFGPLGVPILFGTPFGHGVEKATMPLGVRARIDADASELIITESAVLPA